MFETTRGNTFLENKQLSVEYMDLFTYINSKFIYVERHIFREMSKLYHDLLTHKCQLNQQVSKNFLIIATQAPDEFAYHLMKIPGYKSIILYLYYIYYIILYYYSIFGWSIHLLGALWDSVTNLLLHLGKPETDTEQVKEST